MVENCVLEASEDGVFIVTPDAGVKVICPAPACEHVRIVPTGKATVAFAGIVNVTAEASVKFTI
jgi:hypothetical protein